MPPLGTEEGQAGDEDGAQRKRHELLSHGAPSSCKSWGYGFSDGTPFSSCTALLWASADGRNRTADQHVTERNGLLCQ